MKPTIDKKNVVGIARGEKWTNGQPTGQEATLVFVENKEPLSSLHPDDIIESTIDGLPTDVVGKTGRITAMGCRPTDFARPRVRASGISASRRRRRRNVNRNPRARSRPIVGGISISHYRVTAGTLGVLCRNRRKQIVMLSNNHVIANTNRARIGDVIYQPGTYDMRRSSRNVVGYLLDFVRLRNGVNQDSAVARVRAPYTAFVNRIGRPRRFRHPVRGLRVKKSGRTTGLTRGRIIATNGRFRVNYGPRLNYLITGCIVTTNMCRGGDSGSLLVDMKNRAVGLLFAGSNRITLHNPIIPILRRYRLSLL